MSEKKNKPVLDEQTLAKLLEAAYVLQEHNRTVHELELGLDLKRDQIDAESKVKSNSSPDSPNPRPEQPVPPADYTFTLAQIVATQHQIQLRHLDLEEAISLVAERIVEIARASGAAIGILDGTRMRYRAIAGSHTLDLGTAVPMQKALCLPCIRNAQAFRCPDVNTEFLADIEECRRRGIQSLIAVPIFHEGSVAGGLELYYSMPDAFTDQDVHSCQLMAGLVTEALAREEEVSSKHSLESERALMLEALEKLKPSLTALVESRPSSEGGARVASSVQPSPGYVCTSCGHRLVAAENFCGQCGTPRFNGDATRAQRNPVPSRQGDEVETHISPEPARLAPLPAHEEPGTVASDASLAESLEQEFPELFAAYEAPLKQTRDSRESAPAVSDSVPPSITASAQETNSEISSHTVEVNAPFEQPVSQEGSDEENAKEEAEVAKVETAGDWSSAASAREYLEQLAARQRRSGLARFWDTRRGDIYLAIAVILVACVIRWGIWSDHPAGAAAAPNAATSHQKTDPMADLSPFDRMLISLGLAEPPEIPEDKGNASTRVWVDLQTALYYCPGNDLYGKTPKGKYATQREAQLDQYQPAYRKTCN